MSREGTCSGLHSRVDTVLRGNDPEATREHLRVAAALVVVVAGGTVLAKFIVVSPVVWDAFFMFSVLTLVALSIANAYWEGGLLAGYALVGAPVATGLFVAHYDVILNSQTIQTAVRTIGFGLIIVIVVSLIFGTTGFVLGEIALWARDRTGFKT